MLRLLLGGGAPVSASELMEAVWGEPRTSGLLRVQVNRLRSIVEPSGVRIVTSPYGWSVDRSTYEDLRDRVEEHLAALRTLTNPASVIERCEEALAMWTGPSLADVADEPWAASEATRLDRVRDSLRTRRAEALVRSGAIGQGLAEFTSMVNDRPLDERSVAWAAACLADLGRSGEGLELLGSLRRMLRDEIGFSPSEFPQLAETLILAGRARITDELPLIAPLDTSSHAVSRVDVDPVSSSLLVGRDREWETMVSPDRQAVRVTLITGDEGAGKSSFVAAFVRHRYRSGAITLHGAFRNGSQVPHEAIVDAIASGTGDARLDETVKELPLLDAIRTHSVWSIEDERPEPIGVALAQMLRIIAGESDVVMILDDAHWAPDSSLLAIERMVRSLPLISAQLIDVVLVTRNTGEHRDAADALVTLVKRVDSVVLNLGPLGRAEVATMLGARGRPQAEDDVSRVLALTAGNAFLVSEFVNHGDGALASVADGIDEDPRLRSVLPAPIRQSLQRRLSALSVGARDIARTLACHRVPMPLPVLTDAAPEAERHRLYDGINEAANVGIVVDDPATGSLRVQHGLYEYAILETMPGREREAVHRRIADAYLQRTDTFGSRVSPAFIAEQLEAAGSSASGEELARWLVRAADQARASGAFEAAGRSAEKAVAVIERSGRPDEELLVALAVRQRVAAHASQTLLSKSMGSRIVQLALPTGNIDAAADAVGLHCSYGRDIREDPQSLALADLVIDQAPAGSTALARALAAKGLHSAVWLGNAVQGRALSLRARTIADEAASETARAEAAWALGMSSLAASSLDELDEAATDLRRSGLKRARNADTIRSWRLMAFAALQRGDTHAMQWAITELKTLAGEPSEWHGLTDVARWQSTIAHLEGRFDDAENHRLLQRERGFGLAAFEGSAIAQEGLQLYAVGQLTPDHLMFPVVRSNRTALLSLDALTAELALVSGEHFDAAGRLHELVTELGPTPMNRNRLCDFATLTRFAEVAADHGHDVHASAALLRTWMESYRGAFAFAGIGEHVFGSLDRYLGISASLSGDQGAAERDFAQATRAEMSRGWSRAADETAAATKRHKERAYP